MPDPDPLKDLELLIRSRYAPFLRVALALALALPAAAEPAGRVVLISIDALRPEFYLREGDGAYPAATLKRLAREGAYAKEVEDVFPSVTYPNHATMITGVRPARHGVIYNDAWDPAFRRKGWYWFASDLKARTLWDAVREAKGTSAGLSWPVTVDAPLDWNIPEGAGSKPDRVTALRDRSTRGLLAEVEAAAGPLTAQRLTGEPPWDAFLAKAAVAILTSHKPHLLLVHIVQCDGAQHEHGREHDAVRAAVKGADAAVAEILDGLKAAGVERETTVIVTGDHGFLDYRKVVAPNFVLREAGLIAGDKDAFAWQAVAHVSAAAAGVYVREGGKMSAADVEKLLREKAVREGQRLYNIVTRAELDALGAMPGAAFGLEAEPGYSLSGSLNPKEFVRDAGGTKGTHGYLPSRPELRTGLILWGRGVKPGAVLEQARLIDVAPTAAKLMGVSMPDVEGRVLNETLNP